MTKEQKLPNGRDCNPLVKKFFLSTFKVQFIPGPGKVLSQQFLGPGFTSFLNYYKGNIQLLYFFLLFFSLSCQLKKYYRYFFYKFM